MQMSRWAASGVLDWVFQRLQQAQLLDPEVFGLDPTSVKVHRDATGALRKRGPQAIGRSRAGMNTKIHMIAASARSAVIFALSLGQDHDAPHGRKLLQKLGPQKKKQEGEQLQLFLVADRAYEGTETRQLAVALGYTPVIPPRCNRRHPCDYDRPMYKRRNEVERLFHRLKGYRCVFTRYDKLDPQRPHPQNGPDRVSTHRRPAATRWRQRRSIWRCAAPRGAVSASSNMTIGVCIARVGAARDTASGERTTASAVVPVSRADGYAQLVLAAKTRPLPTTAVCAGGRSNSQRHRKLAAEKSWAVSASLGRTSEAPSPIGCAVRCSIPGDLARCRVSGNQSHD